MTPGPSDAAVRNRYFVLALSRIGGVIIALVGVVALGGKWPAVPVWAGYVVVLLGLVLIAFLPRALARRWRTPPEE